MVSSNFLQPKVLAPLLRQNNVQEVEKKVGTATNQSINLDDKDGVDKLIQCCDNGTKERLHPGDVWDALLPKLNPDNRQDLLLKTHSDTGNTVLTVACEHGHPSFPYCLLKDSKNPVEVINKAKKSKPINLNYQPGNSDLLNSPVWAERSNAHSPYWESSHADSSMKELSSIGKDELVKAMPIENRAHLGYIAYGPNHWQAELLRLEGQERAKLAEQESKQKVALEARLTKAIDEFTPQEKKIYDDLPQVWHERTTLAEREPVINNIKLGRDPNFKESEQDS
jgi:hypothetical protein